MKGLQHRIAVAQGQAEADLVLKSAHYVNVFTGQVEEGDIAISQGYIAGIGQYSAQNQLDCRGKILLPGLIDSHIHLESSLLMPSEFAKAVLPHGTTTLVTDPHEIANVMGTDGIHLMLQASANLPLEVFFLLPSCVPATPLDESGATLTPEDMALFHQEPRILGLAEMMNYVGLIQGDPDVLAKVKQAPGHVLDGHAPFLSGQALQGYLTAGIGSDHECATLAEAQEKLRFGQYIMIREGTAAHNLETLAPLITEKTVARCLFCTDDKHPNHLLEEGHIDMILKKAVSLGVDPIHAVQMASLNAAQYFHLAHKGAIAPSYQADLVLVDNLRDFKVSAVYKKGQRIQENTSFAPSLVNPSLLEKAQDTFHLPATTAQDFETTEELGVIGLIPGEILTTNQGLADKIAIEEDILLVSVLERHKNTGHQGLGYLKGYGLKSGAIATSIAHDSHNVIVVGCSPAEMSLAVNTLRLQKGGMVVVKGDKVTATLPLEVGGIMSQAPLAEVNQNLESAKKSAYAQGVSPNIDPFMSLSFLSLPVIPSLRIITKGVFDVETQSFINKGES